MRIIFPSLLLCLVPLTLSAQVTHLDTLRHYDVQPIGSYSAIWGYTAPDGREYALLGVNGGASYPGGTSIIDITDVNNVQQVAFIQGPNSSWREMKTYRHYAYVVTEAGGGTQIINLSQLPDTAWLVRSFTYTNAGKNTASSHSVSLHDGFLYLNGCASWSPGGMVIFDLRQDPENPVYVGQYQPEYIHDSYVLRDTIYGSAIYGGGGVYIADARDKSNIQLIGKITYSGSGTHNAWVTKDRRYVISTDEIGSTPKTLKMWNISNLPTIPTSPAATFTSAPGQIEHNITIRGDYAYVAWYSAGVRVVNIADPAAPTDAGGYDTSPTTSGYNGIWGIYPYFPSGKIIAGDMQNGLWVFSFSDLQPRVPVAMLEPEDQAVVGEVPSILFRWTKSADLNKDPHYYEVHLTGPSLDTTWRANDTITSLTNTSVLQVAQTYSWHVVTRDEWNTTASPDTFQFVYGFQTGVAAIVVVSPNGGESWQYNSAHDIRWASNLVDTVDISYKTSPAGSWIDIAPSIPSSVQSYSWAIPNSPTTQARVRIIDAQNGAVLDSSNGFFSITVPLITISEDSIDFGDVGTGLSRVDTLRIFNTGTAPLGISNITIDSTGFSVSRSLLTVPPGSSDTISVRFAPSQIRPYSATMTLVHNAPFAPVTVSLSGTGIFVVSVGDEGTPLTFALSQNYPNPFNPATTIDYEVGEKSAVSLRVFNVLGEEVAVLVNAVSPAGRYKVAFDAHGLPSGIYFYRLKAGAFSEVQKMVLAR